MKEPQDIESLKAEVKALRAEVKDLKEVIRVIYNMIGEENEEYVMEYPGDIGRYNT